MIMSDLHSAYERGFLGAYVLVLAAIPLLYRITGTARLAAGVVGSTD